MSLIGLLIALIIIAVIVWIISIMPLPHPWKTILMIAVALIFIIYLLQGLGGINIRASPMGESVF